MPNRETHEFAKALEMHFVHDVSAMTLNRAGRGQVRIG